MVKDRTKNIGINISFNMFFKIVGGMLSYLIIPLTLDFLSKERYGIWMTILSFVSWFNYFDMGLGNGLRNKLTEAIAINKKKLARKYVSTAYFFIFFIAILISFVIILIYPLVNWQHVFNTTNITNHELLFSMGIISILFILNFAFSLCNSIFYAYQKPAFVALSNVLFQLIFICLICIFRIKAYEHLIVFSFLYGTSIILSNVLLTIYFFHGHIDILPSLKFFDKLVLKDIMSLGIKFFIIQISSLIVLTTDNIIITQILGPTYVTEYNIVYKLFSAITMIHGGIFLNTLWSSYTEAYKKQDFNWVKTTFNKTKKLLVGIWVIILIVIILSKKIIGVWIGSSISISSDLVLFMGIYTFVVAWNGTYCSILNGLGKVNLQMYISIYSSIVNIPLSIYLVRNLHLGSSGIILASTLSIIPSSLILPFQIRGILKEINYKNL